VGPLDFLPIKRELFREVCYDEDGNKVLVIAWLDLPCLSGVSYTLEDGTPVMRKAKAPARARVAR